MCVNVRSRIENPGIKLRPSEIQGITVQNMLAQPKILADEDLFMINSDYCGLP